MLLWLLAAFVGPAQLDPAHLVLGLALVATAALLVAAATAMPVRASAAAFGVRAFERRSRTAPPPRLRDPDAAGRPRPRAPGGYPAAA